MIVYPAMDLMAGCAVRLKQGRFEDQTSYQQAPADALRSFACAGAEWAHVVDLDGARAKRPMQHDLIASLVGTTGLKLQVGGGFRTRGQVRTMLEAGAERVVIGSLAVEEPELVKSWIEDFGPDRLALSLDVRMAKGVPIVAVSGWTQESGLSLWEVAARFPRARHLLLTDIERDGMLSGPNFDLLDEAADRLSHLSIQASGGISTIEDIDRLKTDGVIVGRALWEGRVQLAEVVALARA